MKVRRVWTIDIEECGVWNAAGGSVTAVSADDGNFISAQTGGDDHSGPLPGLHRRSFLLGLQMGDARFPLVLAPMDLFLTDDNWEPDIQQRSDQWDTAL